jgi:selenoprotein W-related protein
MGAITQTLIAPIAPINGAPALSLISMISFPRVPYDRDQFRNSAQVANSEFARSPALLSAVASMPRSPTIEITYCRLCGWGLRAGWMAQELLTTFAEELGSVTLTPDVTGGVFEVRLDSDLIWSRKEKGRFPEIKELKQLVRDHVAPGRSLGHVDRD